MAERLLEKAGTGDKKKKKSKGKKAEGEGEDAWEGGDEDGGKTHNFWDALRTHCYRFGRKRPFSNTKPRLDQLVCFLYLCCARYCSPRSLYIPEYKGGLGYRPDAGVFYLRWEWNPKGLKSAVVYCVGRVSEWYVH